MIWLDKNSRRFRVFWRCDVASSFISAGGSFRSLWCFPCASLAPEGLRCMTCTYLWNGSKLFEAKSLAIIKRNWYYRYRDLEIGSVNFVCDLQLTCPTVILQSPYRQSAALHSMGWATIRWLELTWTSTLISNWLSKLPKNMSEY